MPLLAFLMPDSNFSLESSSPPFRQEKMTLRRMKTRVLAAFAVLCALTSSSFARETLVFTNVQEFEVTLGKRAALTISASPIAKISIAAYAAALSPSPLTGLILAYQVIKSVPSTLLLARGLLNSKETLHQRRAFETLLTHPSAPTIYQISYQIPDDSLISRTRRSKILTWIDSEKALGAETIAALEAEWGKSLAISDLDHTQIRIRLEIDGIPSNEIWETTLASVMNRDPIPESVREQWLTEYQEKKKFFRQNHRSRWKNWLQTSHPETNQKIVQNPKASIELPLEIVTASGESIAFGPIASKGSAVKLLKTPFKERVRDLVFDGVEMQGHHLPIRMFENTPGLCSRLIRSTIHPFIRWVENPVSPQPTFVQTP